MMEIYAGVITLIVYIIGLGISISSSTTSHHCRDDFSGVDTTYRDAEPKDAWLSLIWPLRVIRGFIWLTIAIVNDVVCYPLLLLGFKYKNTNLYKKIDKITDDKF